MVVWVIQMPNSMLLFTIREKQAGVTGNIFKNSGVGRHAHSVVKGTLKWEIKWKIEAYSSLFNI